MKQVKFFLVALMAVVMGMSDTTQHTHISRNRIEL